MTSYSHSSEPFIVDNSVSGWTGLRYLQQWCAFARMFDIATGYFEIGALLALNENWQKLDKIRILMGADTTLKTRKVLLQSIQQFPLAAFEPFFQSTWRFAGFRRAWAIVRSDCPGRF